MTKSFPWSILRHFDATPDERNEYLRRANAMRRALHGEDAEETVEVEEGATAGAELGDKYAAMDAAEQFVLTISENGFWQADVVL